MHKINYPLITRVQCWLLLIEAAFMLIPLGVAILCRESGAAHAFGIAAAITAIIGATGAKFIPVRNQELGKRESFLLTASVWVIFSLFGMIPFILAPSAGLSVTEAFFEAMSGFTTTGASLIDDTNSLSQSLSVWHCLSQWIGGLGIIIFTIAIIPMFNSSGGIQMFNAEATGIAADKLRPRISETAKEMWLIYLSLTILLFILLLLGPMDAIQAACHAMSTMSTGGFSTSASGINAWDTPYVKIVITLFMFLGGINFAIIFRAIHRQFNQITTNDPLKTYCKTILTATAIFITCIIIGGNYTGWQSVTIDPLFQVISCISSTGYALSNFTQWGPAITAIAILLMIVGGCAGSTSGGAKIDRVVYLWRFLVNEIRLVLRPNSVAAVRVNNKVVSAHAVRKVLAFLWIYIFIMAFGGIALSLLGVPMANAFYCSFASITNAGFETWSDIYFTIPPTGLWVLSFIMLAGRLEIFTVIILFTRTFWRK